MQIIPLKQGNDTYVSIDQSFFYNHVSGRISIKTFQAVAFGLSGLQWLKGLCLQHKNWQFDSLLMFFNSHIYSWIDN